MISFIKKFISRQREIKRKKKEYLVWVEERRLNKIKWDTINKTPGHIVKKVIDNGKDYCTMEEYLTKMNKYYEENQNKLKEDK